MKYQIEKIDEVKVIRLHEKRLDTNIAPDLKTLFLVWIKPDDAHILVDVKDVVYVDSSGLGAILFGLRQAREHNGTVKLLSAQKRVRDLIQIAQLEGTLENFVDEDEALQSFYKE